MPGVGVGHATVRRGEARTGVTAILPHGGDLFADKPLAAVDVLNGFGKSVGLIQVAELGTLETPVLLTNTFAVGTCANALIRRAVRANPAIGRRTGTVNPVVLECNDGFLSRHPGDGGDRGRRARRRSKRRRRISRSARSAPAPA